MKKYLLLMLVVLTGIVTSCNYDDDELWGSVEDLANRVSAMETLTKQKNSDIAAMQAIINGLENQVSVSEVENLTDGYILHFTDGASVTIKNGKNGKDGANGEDGKDGANGKDGKDGADGENGKDGANGKDGKDGTDGKDAPSIFVDQENGIWYWTITIDGKTQWLTDSYGRKIEVISKGSMDGVDGKDGITPLLRIAKGSNGLFYWEVSTNNGNSYSRITFNGNELVAQDTAVQGDKGDPLFDDVVVNGDKVKITVHNGSEFELLFQKSVIFYDESGNEVNTKNTPLNGSFTANYIFKLKLDNAKFEVVADDGVNVNVCGIGTSGAVDYNNMTVSIDIHEELNEARAVILFFSENKTITAVFKFNISPWDGRTVKAVTPNANGEYEINFPSELAWIAQQVNKGNTLENKTVKLMYDIDLAGQSWTPIGTISYPFKGRFNGNGKLVKNLSVGSAVFSKSRALQSRATEPTAGVGMFGVAENATFENVTISNAQTNSNKEGAAGILVGVTNGTTEISGVTIENGSASATGSESAAGLLVGKATGSITVSDVTITTTSEEETNNKVEATYSGGVVGHVAADNVKIENATVTGLDLGIKAENGEAAAGGAVLGKIEPATEDGGINITVTGAEVESVKVAVSSETTNDNATNVSVGAVAGAISNAANANIQISDSNVKDVKVETESEEAAENINQGSVLGNLNEVIEVNPSAGAEILDKNTVDNSVEIKNQMKVETLNTMLDALEWKKPEYNFDIDGEIEKNTTLQIPNVGYSGKLNLNFKNLETAENAVFTINMNYMANPVGMVVNLDFNPDINDQYITLYLKDATVNLQSGHFKRLISGTAANTLYIKDGVTVKDLQITHGNVYVVGTGKITESITNYSNNVAYVTLREGATTENNLPSEENIGKNIEITSTVIITNTELARGLANRLGSNKITIDENGYGIIRTDVAESVIELDFRWYGFQITNFEGLEYFTNLEVLRVDGYVTELDLSKNKALKEFEMRFCTKLKSAVDFSQNPNLESLNLGYVYYIPSINLSGCSKLNYLNLENNYMITSVDLSGCSNLTQLYLGNTQAITELNLSNLNKLEILELGNTKIAQLDLSSCKNLKSLGISNTSISELNIPNPQSLTTLDVSNTSLSIDLNGFVNLTALYINNLNLENLDIIPNNVKANLERLVCHNNQLQYIDMSLFRNLNYFQCNNNALKNLDLSSATKLKYLECSYNSIKSLNVSVAKSLESLYCYNNNLETLDISALNSLKTLACGRQQNVLTLTISENQKELWTDRWKTDTYYNSGVRLDSEIIKDPEAETGGNGFGNGGKI